MISKYNVDEVKVIKQKDKIKLCFKGWVIPEQEGYELVVYRDNKPSRYMLNQYRADVLEIFAIEEKINVGFGYEEEISEFKTLDIRIKRTDCSEISIYKSEYEDIPFIYKKESLKDEIIFNVEQCKVFKESSIGVEIKGWVFNKISSKPVKLRILDDKERCLYECATNVKREDVKKAYSIHNIPLESGFSVCAEVTKDTEYISVYFIDDQRPIMCKKIEIPEYIKIDEEFIKDRIKQLKAQHTKEMIRQLAKNPSFIFKLKTYKEECLKQINEEEIRLRQIIELKIDEVTPYERWVENNIITKDMIEGMEKEIKQYTYLPKISILMPVWNVEKVWLDKAIGSIKKQTYTNWELCIAEDCSTKEYIRPYLEQLCLEDKRVKVYYRKENGNISKATNSAFEISTGEYILLMDNDDELEVNALYEIVKTLQKNRAQIIYSDDDKIDEKGYRYDPQFKPDWSPELLLSFMYFSHLFCMTRELYAKVKGCRTGFEGCQDYDLALRVTELTDDIVHISKVLYHWRSLEGSTALDGNAKPEAFERGIKAVQEALDRRKITGRVVRPDFAISNNLGIFSIEFPNVGPKVSIVIPTKNHVDLVKRCVDSILNKTTYTNYEIVIINNDSDEETTLSYLNEIRDIYKVLDIQNKDNKFSYSYINNEAVKRLEGEYILLLNNDTEVINPNWLSAMVGYLQIKDVEIVGARLIFPDDRVQHAGVVMGLYNGMVAPAFKLIPDYSLGYFNFAKVSRNYSCVTAACLLISKKFFNQIGQFDEDKFAVAYNDVDLCMKCINAGKRVVYAPQAELYHYEGASRGYVDNIDEILAFKEKYGDYKDKYYNPNLSLRDEQFNISPDNTLDYERFVKNRTSVFCTHNLNLEGAPLHLYEIIKELKEERDRGQVVVISQADGPLKEEYEKLNVKVYVVGFNIHLSLHKADYIKGIEEIIEIVKREHVGLIYANTLEMFYMVSIAKQMGLPALWNIHESVDYKNYFKGADPYVTNKYMNAFIYAKKVIFVCQSTLEMYQEMNRVNNFDYIYNGIDSKEIELYKEKVTKEEARRLVGSKEHTKVITVIGTVCERKGQLDVVKAMKKLVGEEVELLLVGCRENDYLSQIKAYIKENNLKNIYLISETKDVNLYYRATDIFVCSSYNESFPRVTLEAMCFELPIVTTPVFGLKEQVLNEVNGLYYEAGNINALCNVLSTLLYEDSIYTKYKSNSKKVLNLLNSHDEMINRYKKIISK